MPTKHRFDQLEAQARRLAAVDLQSMLQADPARTTDFALRVGPLYANFARQRYDRLALDALFDQLAAAGGTGRLRSLFDGEQVNPTEGRPALHTALRGDLSPAAVARDAHAQAQATRLRMRELIATLAAAGVTDIVSVGIGGSDLGPRLGGDIRFRLDDENLGLQRLDAGLRASLWKVAVSGRYFTVRPALRGGDPRQELTTGVNVDVTDNWRVTYGLRRDLDSDINLSQDASVSYRNSCFIIQLVYTQTETFDRVLGPRRGLQFAIGLTGLGSIAGNR